MDIQLIGKGLFKLKGKTASIITDFSSFKVEVEKQVKMEISEPGEYEVGGISILGMQLGENIIFVFEIDGLRIAYLGEFKKDLTDTQISELKKDLTDTQISELGNIDILVIFEGREKIIGQIDPYFVITENYQGSLPVEKIDKFSLKREDILEDQSTKIIILPQK